MGAWVTGASEKGARVLDFRSVGGGHQPPGDPGLSDEGAGGLDSRLHGGPSLQAWSIRSQELGASMSGNGLLLLKPQCGEGAGGGCGPGPEVRVPRSPSLKVISRCPILSPYLSPHSSLFICSPSLSCPRRRKAEARGRGGGPPLPPTLAGGGVPREAKRGAAGLPAGADGD